MRTHAKSGLKCHAKRAGVPPSIIQLNENEDHLCIVINRYVKRKILSCRITSLLLCDEPLTQYQGINDSIQSSRLLIEYRIQKQIISIGAVINIEIFTATREELSKVGKRTMTLVVLVVKHCEQLVQVQLVSEFTNQLPSTVHSLVAIFCNKTMPILDKSNVEAEDTNHYN